MPYRAGGCYGCAHQGEEISASILDSKWLCGVCRAEVETTWRWKCVKCGEILKKEDAFTNEYKSYDGTRGFTGPYMLCKDCHAPGDSLRDIPKVTHRNKFYFDNPNWKEKQ